MEKSQNKAIGLLGGSFDPAHKGHLSISRIAIKKIKLNKLIWAVAKKNPFKEKPYYSLNQRIKLAKSISNKINKIQVIHLDRVIRSSRSIDIINYLVKKKKNYKYLLYYWVR